jgi:CRISPR-associated protein Cmr5
MRSLEQIRAKNALGAAPLIKAGPGEGDPNAVAKKVPAMIKENGLIATAAFAMDKKEGIQSVVSAIEQHLVCVGIMTGKETLLQWLTGANADSARLRSATDEAMAYLNYLRRFVRKKDKKGQ